MVKPPCAQELLAGGDDGLADGLAGPDGAYDEWRRLYGAEWARWYGLQVRAAQRRASICNLVTGSNIQGTNHCWAS